MDDTIRCPECDSDLLSTYVVRVVRYAQYGTFRGDGWLDCGESDSKECLGEIRITPFECDDCGNIFEHNVEVQAYIEETVAALDNLVEKMR